MQTENYLFLGVIIGLYIGLLLGILFSYLDTYRFKRDLRLNYKDLSHIEKIDVLEQIHALSDDYDKLYKKLHVKELKKMSDWYEETSVYVERRNRLA